MIRSPAHGRALCDGTRRAKRFDVTAWQALTKGHAGRKETFSPWNFQNLEVLDRLCEGEERPAELNGLCPWAQHMGLKWGGHSWLWARKHGTAEGQGGCDALLAHAETFSIALELFQDCGR